MKRLERPLGRIRRLWKQLPSSVARLDLSSQTACPIRYFRRRALVPGEGLVALGFWRRPLLAFGGFPDGDDGGLGAVRS